MKTSRRRKLASRANGAKSKGPKTPEGKARSSYNAVRHGLLSKTTVLACENRETFEKLLDQFVRRFDPVDDVEFGMIEEMAACHWRIRRGWAIETELMNQSVEKHKEGAGTVESCLAAAIRELAGAPELALLNRYEGRLNRMFQRAVRNLLMLRDEKAAAAERSRHHTPELVAETAAEIKADSPAAIAEIKNGRTNLIPNANTPSEPSARPGFSTNPTVPSAGPPSGGLAA